MLALSDCRCKCEILVETFRIDWAERGCTLIGDGWIDKRGGTLMNFIVYCSREFCFLKAMEASKVAKEAQTWLSYLMWYYNGLVPTMLSKL